MFGSGALEETDFLARLYDLDKPPGNDSRYTTGFKTSSSTGCSTTTGTTGLQRSRLGLPDSDERLLAFLAATRASVIAASPLRAITRQAAPASRIVGRPRHR